MNERIKLLADQAGHYVNETYKPPVRSKTPGKIWDMGRRAHRLAYTIQSKVRRVDCSRLHDHVY